MNLLAIKREHLRQWRYNRYSQFKYYNFWRDERPEEMWFSRFVMHHFPDCKQRINFTSVLGPVELMNDRHYGVNIFYTGENMHTDRFSAHQKRYQTQHYDLSIGFNYDNPGNYLRLPLWVMWHFPPNATREQIDKICHDMSYPTIGERNRFCALVCSHDQNGLRKQIMSSLEKIGHIDSAGRYCQNTDSLLTEFADDKPRFLQQYRYNICPENSDHTGYVTEKIFDALKSGCIPIYNGSNNNPEPEVINHNAVLFWSTDNNSHELMARIRNLENSHETYMHFAHQPRLNPQASDVVWEYYNLLHNKLKELL